MQPGFFILHLTEIITVREVNMKKLGCTMCILAFSSFTSLISALPHIREESIWHVACVVRGKNEKDTNTQIALILCHTCVVICFHNSATPVHLRASSFYLCQSKKKSPILNNKSSCSPTLGLLECINTGMNNAMT